MSNMVQRVAVTVGLTAAVAMAAVAMVVSFQGSGDGIEARSFVLVDEYGQERAVLDLDEAGLPELRMYETTPAGALGEQLVLGWNRPGPSVRLFEVAGQLGTLVGFSSHGPWVEVFGPSGDASASLLVDDHASPAFALVDPAGAVRAGIGFSSDDFDPGLLLADPKQTVRVFVGFDNVGPVLSLNDEEHTLRAVISFTDAGPEIRLTTRIGGRAPLWALTEQQEARPS